MAIPALNTTIGDAAANSYISVADAEAYMDSLLNASSWTGATSDDKTRSLLTAARRLDRENWLGTRATKTQRLAWPRVGAVKPDPVGAAVGYGGYWGGYGETYASTEIPQPVKDAQCELALAYLEGFDESGDDDIDSFSSDGVFIKHRTSKPQGGLPAAVLQLIAPLIAGNRLVRG